MGNTNKQLFAKNNTLRQAGHSKAVNNSLSSCFAVFLLLLFVMPVCAQTTENKRVGSVPSPSVSNRLCVVPTGLSYTNNNAFYCTGLPITPNVLTYTGTAATSYNISPDLPVGLSFNLLNGTITGTPTVAAAGNYVVTLNNPCGFTSKILYIAVSSGTNYYSDVDGDGYGTGVATVSCTGQPAGTSTNNTDCAPGDATKWRIANFFTDSDHDGYDSGLPRTTLCYGGAVPSGYTLVYIGTDCDDGNPKVNPNVSEVAGNGFDDNCDGVIDEVTTLSKLTATSCGITVASLSSTLFCVGVPGAQGYRFEVTNGIDVHVFETPIGQFNLLNLSPGVTFSSTNTVNTVRVSVKTGGFWRPYGASCVVNTPPVPNSTSISNPANGAILSDIWNTIFCYNNPLATAYRFRVRNGATVVGTYDSTTNNFSLVNLGISNLVFGIPYTIDVLMQIGGTWLPDSEYGDTRTIISPPTPGVSKISNPSCGSSTNNLWASVFAIPVMGAQGYKFVVTNGIRYLEVITTLPQFTIHDIPGGPMTGTTYTIRVDVLYNNSYVPGRETCTLTVLPTAARLNSTDGGVFDAKAYPNPFTDSFRIVVDSSDDLPVEVKVYDLFGLAIETVYFDKMNGGNFEIGNHYRSGVYQVVVTQGQQVRTLRVIKR